MLAGMRDILLISTPRDIPAYHELLGDGSQWGVNIQCETQPSPDGLAQAFTIGERFLNGHNSALVLGDNIHFDHDILKLLKSANRSSDGTIVFAYCANDPERYGVVEFDDQGIASGLEKNKFSQS